MDLPEQISEVELLFKLRLDFVRALQLEDYLRINNVIFPEFWEHFGKHFEEFGKLWKDLSLSRRPVKVILDPGQRREAELDWAEKVLKGQIDLIFEP